MKVKRIYNRARVKVRRMQARQDKRKIESLEKQRNTALKQSERYARLAEAKEETRQAQLKREHSKAQFQSYSVAERRKRKEKIEKVGRGILGGIRQGIKGYKTLRKRLK